MLRPRLRRDTSTNPPIKQQIRTPIITICSITEDVVSTDIGDEFIVDPDPGGTGTVVQVPIRVENVEGVVSS